MCIRDSPCPTSGFIVHGQNDAVVPHEAVEKLLKKLSHQRGINLQYHLMANADHFFNQHLDPLSQKIEEYLTNFSKIAKTVSVTSRRRQHLNQGNIDKLITEMDDDDGQD